VDTDLAQVHNEICRENRLAARAGDAEIGRNCRNSPRHIHRVESIGIDAAFRERRIVIIVVQSSLQSGARNSATVRFRRLDYEAGLPRQREQIVVAANQQVGSAAVGKIEERLILRVAA